MATLPLFPLNTVLFPGARLPLRIFEERYKLMLRTCLEGDRRFGVVLIKSGEEVGGQAEPCRIGTSARLGKIGEPSKGAIPLTVTGERRFRIVKIDRSLPYLRGEVEYLEETADPEAPAAAEELRVPVDRYLRILLAARGEYRGRLEVTADPEVIAEVAGSMLSGHPADVRQSILEAEPLSQRLRLMARAISRSISSAETFLMGGGPGRQRRVFGIN